MCPTLIVGLLAESCHHIFFSQTYHTLIFKNLTLDLKVNISWWNTCSADTNSSLNLFLQFARISTSFIFSSWLLRLLRSDKIFHLRYLETKVCWVKYSVEWTGCPVRQPVQLLVDQFTLYCEILYDVHSLLITCHQFFLSKIYVLIFFLFSSYQFNVIYVHLFLCFSVVFVFLTVPLDLWFWRACLLFLHHLHGYPGMWVVSIVTDGSQPHRKLCTKVKAELKKKRSKHDIMSTKSFLKSTYKNNHDRYNNCNELWMC